MTTSKQTYIQRIRSTSAYPTFRTFIGIIALLLYIFGLIAIIGGVLLGLAAMQSGDQSGIIAIFLGPIVGIIYIIIGKVLKEASLMLADIADSITDLNSRYE